MALAGALSLLAAACGDATEPPVGSTQSPIIGGEVDRVHNNVFGLFIDRGRSTAVCSATLIAPNLLITARHCVVEPTSEAQVICGRSHLGPPEPATNMYATNAVEARDDSLYFQGAAIDVPSEGNDTCGYDIALLTLGSSVPKSVATPAIPRIDRDVTADEAYIAVGYGLNDSGRAGARRVRAGLRVLCEPGTCGQSVRVSEFIGDQGVCEGDSGGPAFDEQGKLVGVVSRGATDCSSPVYGTVTVWRDLIREVALRAAERGRYDAPFWATTGSSDPPAGAAPEPVGAGAGEVCREQVDCAAGLLCLAGSEASGSKCAASCDKNSDCLGTASCQFVDSGPEKACLEAENEPSDLDSSGCAFTGEAGSTDTAPGRFWAVAAAFGLVLVAKRRACAA